LTPIKKEILKITNRENISGSLYDALKNSDVFIGVSKGNLLKASDVKTMAKKAMIFAMANPTPEIMPSEALRAGATIVASGRSDFPNQINNVLVYPGIFKGAIESRTSQITDEMKIAAAEALAAVVERPTTKKIIPDLFNKKVVLAVAGAIKKLAKPKRN
jgi:malate dehydrogenase (oxaloacetate-decarboxylating)